MFVVHHYHYVNYYQSSTVQVLVVLSSEREVDFWLGGETAFGEIAPGVYVELL